MVTVNLDSGQVFLLPIVSSWICVNTDLPECVETEVLFSCMSSLCVFFSVYERQVDEVQNKFPQGNIKLYIYLLTLSLINRQKCMMTQSSGGKERKPRVVCTVKR